MKVFARKMGWILAALLLSAPGASAIEKEECPTWFPDFRCDRHGRWEGFVAPMSMPYQFEDPFITTGLQGVGIWHNYPQDSIFDGGHVWVAALQARVAITDKLALIATKDGYANHRPEFALLSDDEGFWDIALGFKYAALELPDKNFILTPALRFEIPVGQDRVYAGYGDGQIWPSFSFGWQPLEKFNLIGNFGAMVPFNQDKGSTSIFYNLHLSYNLFKWFVPLVEFSGQTWVGDGDGTRGIKLTGVPGNPVIPLTAAQAATGTGPFEGVDVVNLGSEKVSGNNIINFAVGARIPFTRNLSFGAIYEFPMTSRRDLTKQRVTMSLLFEF